MKFLLLVYNDPSMVDAMPPQQYDASMRDCLTHADELRGEGRLLQSQMLEEPRTAKSVRIRGNRLSVVDGPFAETKEVLGGYNIVEADSIDDAVRMAAEFPWAATGCIEVRPIRDIESVRQRVFSTATSAGAGVR